MRLALGMREWVAIGVLAVALAIGALFYSTTSGDADFTPRTPPTATATPPPHAIEGESQWTVTFLATGDPETVIAQAQRPVLDFDYSGAPFLDVKDGQWRMLAVTRFDGPAGEYAAFVTYAGEISVAINDQDLGITSSTGAGTAVLPISKEAGKPVVIRVSVRDSGGRFILKWQLVKRP